MTPRTDHATHALVEMGLNFCCHRYAAEFMARNEVPFEVAYRVLLKPSQHRAKPTPFEHDKARHAEWDALYTYKPVELDIDLSGNMETLWLGERPMVIGLDLDKGKDESAYHWSKS